MNTFDAIAHIRRESLPRADALRFLMEKLGFSAIYAEEIVAVVLRDDAGNQTLDAEPTVRSA